MTNWFSGYRIYHKQFLEIQAKENANIPLTEQEKAWVLVSFIGAVGMPKPQNVKAVNLWKFLKRLFRQKV